MSSDNSSSSRNIAKTHFHETKPCLKGEEASEDVPEEDEVDTAIVDELSEALAMVSAGMRNSVESTPIPKYLPFHFYKYFTN